MANVQYRLRGLRGVYLPIEPHRRSEVNEAGPASGQRMTAYPTRGSRLLCCNSTMGALTHLAGIVNHIDCERDLTLDKVGLSSMRRMRSLNTSVRDARHLGQERWPRRQACC